MSTFHQTCGQNHIWSFGKALCVGYVPVNRHDVDWHWCGTVEYFDFLGQCWYVLARLLSVLCLVASFSESCMVCRSHRADGPTPLPLLRGSLLWLECSEKTMLLNPEELWPQPSPVTCYRVSFPKA